MSTRPPLLFYCQHSVGLGHLMRSYALCAHLAEWFRVVLACGGSLPRRDRPAAGRRDRRAAAARRRRGVALRQPRPALHGRARVGARAASCCCARCAPLRPAVVFVELFPFGRAKFARELVPLLELAREGGADDRLQPARHPRHRPRRPGRPRRARVPARQRAPRRGARPLRPALRAARGDLRACDQLHRPGPLHRLRRSATAARAPAERERRVVVSAGGGLVGEPLLRAAIEAQRIGTGLPMRAIAGPLMPEDALSACARRPPACRTSSCCAPSRTSRRELAGAAAAVSQGGYNTDARDRARAASRRWSSPTPRRRRTSSCAARAGSSGSARCECSSRPARTGRARRRDRAAARVRARARRRSTSTAAAARARSCGT